MPYHYSGENHDSANEEQGYNRVILVPRLEFGDDTFRTLTAGKVTSPNPTGDTRIDPNLSMRGVFILRILFFKGFGFCYCKKFNLENKMVYCQDGM
ncbi:hypothetical protein AVEN_203379-1 [Araneus ventricosus]|uniref:Uncharacterized protein n=1 Tax=Araneus ventricosus TaxID=182803 RepID=A0A4Y2UQJ7_ARAVE|nr:hypothetical protein AVEN_203379-1 [Araneus ventricosus]